jgi:HlyD family secretion protein
MTNDIPQKGGKKNFKYLANNKKLVGIIIAVLIIGWLAYRHYNTAASPTRYLTAAAQKQTVISTVSGTGQVSEDRSVNITPQSAGKLTAVNFKQGAQVKTGNVIAIVDETNNTLSLNQAKAGLASAQASYSQMLAGATTQDIQLAQLSVSADQQALDNANTNLTTVTKQQNQAVANAFSNYLNSGSQAVPNYGNIGTGAVTVSGTYSGTDQGKYTIILYSTGNGLQFSYNGLESGSGIINKTTPIALGTKGLYILFSGNIYSGDTWIIAIPNPMSSSYASSYNTYQNAQTSQAAALTSAQNQIQSAQNKLAQDQINLQVKQLPPTQQQQQSAKAQLTQAQAQLQNAQINYDNNILKAPFDGQIAQINGQVGDQVGGSTVVATVVTNEPIAVISLNENDVAKIKVGGKATMTFNAISDLTITGVVAEIDNIGTVSQGVVSYNVKIAFDTQDLRIKPGMSVSASLITGVAADVLTVPISAVQSQGNINYVLTLDPKQTQSASGQTGVTSNAPPKMVTVQVGISDDTNTEITGGLNEGDTVVTQTITASAAKSAASSATNALRIGGGGGFGGGNAVIRATTGGAAGR